MQVLYILVELEFGDDGFCGRNKTHKKTLRAKATQPTYGSERESNPGHAGGLKGSVVITALCTLLILKKQWPKVVTK